MFRTPTIHLNGTSREALADATVEAGQALRAALRALEACAPNGRDYYPQGPEALGDAMRKHVAAVESLRAVLAGLEAHAENILEA